MVSINEMMKCEPNTFFPPLKFSSVGVFGHCKRIEARISMYQSFTLSRNYPDKIEADLIGQDS